MDLRLPLLFVTFFVFGLVNFSFGQEKLSESALGQQILDYIKNNDKLNHLSGADISDIYLDRTSYSKQSGVTHVYLYQSYKGVKIYNAISNLAIKNNEIFYFKNNFISNIEDKVNVLSPSLKAVEAMQKTATHFKMKMEGTPEEVSSSAFKKVFAAGDLSQEHVPVELMYLKDKEGNLKLAWDLNIYTLDSKHWWSVRVDALSGVILDKDDWVINCSFEGEHTHTNENITSVAREAETFNVFKKSSFLVDNSQYNVLPLPIESPNHGSFQVVTEPADPVASPFGWHDTDGVVGAEHTDTRGNNVWAQDDLDGSNFTNGTSPDGTASLNFNFPTPNLNQEADNYLDAATINLFYHNNVVHDIFYHYGFDELNGNFQENNYGKGGDEGDSVVAQAQDGSGTNNANFATPPDGSAARMQMFLWSRAVIAEDNLTISGGTIAGNYNSVKPSRGNGADGPGNITGPSSTPVTGALVIADDGGVVPEEGCSPLINSANMAGKIAVIRRGSCNFTAKIQNAQDAGAIAVIVANHNNPDSDPNYVPYVNMYGVTDPEFTIPSIFINFDDGETIINAIRRRERITATIVDNGPFFKDSSFDNGIIIHEYGHGITTRLTGGANNSSCLNNNFQMGEGWSDWFALMLTMKPSDVGTDGRGIGTFANGEEIDGRGIRTRRYSTDVAINEYTFNETNDDRVIGQDADTGEDIKLNESVHYNGTIWATILWDLTWAYIDKYGFDPDLYNGTGGNNKVMALIIESLKLQGCNPDFIDGRDGILAADTALSGGVDQCLIWEVFAARGLGVAASRGELNVFNDQVEDFTTPDPSDISLANCTTLSNDNFSAADYNVFPNPASNILTISSGRNLGGVTLELVDINGRIVLSQSATLVRNVEIDISGLQSGLYVLKIIGEYNSTNHKIIKE
ncbi:T9SS type A sorting domain-containing protein [Hyunsoonleella flava]|uniref:T9SS type A sorting domain-containing protein n=2 Tax=Pseudomonadati TaxID=3379134 RepID=A0A4Q9FC42_9FLAO|nr:T9SS-dependent M36 family metallopeptidase [Hyunsoonleella flava]TBN02423.1 T9SS type A sorting domain-containing protein [Hyunsoonleella flava]